MTKEERHSRYRFRLPLSLLLYILCHLFLLRNTAFGFSTLAKSKITLLLPSIPFLIQSNSNSNSLLHATSRKNKGNDNDNSTTTSTSPFDTVSIVDEGKEKQANQSLEDPLRTSATHYKTPLRKDLPLQWKEKGDDVEKKEKE